MSIYTIDVHPEKPLRGDYLRIVSRFYGIVLVWDDLPPEERETWIAVGKAIHKNFPWGIIKEGTQ